MKTKLTRFLNRSFEIDFTEAIQQGVGEFALPYSFNSKKCSLQVGTNQSKNVFPFNGTCTIRIIEKPQADEYPPYSSIYMNHLPDDGKILEHLRKNWASLKNLINNLAEDRLQYRYAPNKWTIKEILVHLIDDERIFSYRALRYARKDSTPLHAFEQNDYNIYSMANTRSLDSIFCEYATVREATISLFENFPEVALTRRGSVIEAEGQIANERTVRALVYHIAGHELRHTNIIKERYL